MPIRPFNGAGIEIIKWLSANYAIVAELFPLIAEWRAITEPADTVSGLKARVVVALKAAKIVASHTPGEIDDKAVAMIDTVLSNDAALTILVELIKHFQQGPVAPSDPPAEGGDVDDGWDSPVRLATVRGYTAEGVDDRLKARALKVGFPDVATLMSLAKLLYELFAMFRSQ